MNNSNQYAQIEDIPNSYKHVSENGEIFLIKNVFPEYFQHGSNYLTASNNYSWIDEWARIPDCQDRNQAEYLFIDAETTGLAGGAGSFAFLIGLGYWESSGFTILQIFLPSPDLEATMLSFTTDFVSTYKNIISFNGRSFDIPLLNSRFILNQLPSPFIGLGHIDLLILARKIWRKRLASRSLSSLELEILGVERGSLDVPGWKIPEIYSNYLISREVSQLFNVIYHNQMDLLSLCALFTKMAGLDDDNELQQLPAVDIISMAEIFEGLGNVDKAVRLYEIGLSQSLPRQILVSTLARYARLCKRDHRWSEAREVWKHGAAVAQWTSCVELAKYFEHVSRDYAQALSWVEKAEQIMNAPESETNPFEKHEGQISLAKRKSRLLRKLNRI